MRVWFNRAYATTAHLIAQLRDNPEGRAVHVISTHTDPDSPVLGVSDVAAAEPRLSGADYVEWAVQFATEHHVDVLVPRHRMAELAEARDRFTAIGTAVACPAADTVRLFADKAAAYAAASALGVTVPPHAVVTDSLGLRSAFAQFAAFGGQVCMKPVVGVGGAGYRRLTDQRATSNEFAGELHSVVRVDAVAEAWDRAGGPPAPVLVMPFLNGVEVSVDVVATPEGQVLAAVGRRHGEPRRRELVDDPLARATAETLTVAHRVGFLSNTQVRYWRGPGDDDERPYFLEVNTRAAGGLFQTALAGVNLPWAALKVALGEAVPPLQPSFGARYVQVASMIELRRTQIP